MSKVNAPPARQVVEAVIPMTEIEVGENLGRLESKRVASPGLLKTIRKVGLLEPLVVTKIAPHRYRLVAGEDRYLALRELGENFARVSIRYFESEAKMALAAIAENVSRTSTPLYEVTMLVHRQATRFESHPDDIADHLGLSVRDVRTMIRVPDVLTREQLEAFKKARTDTTARIFLAAARKHSPKERAEFLKKNLPRPFGRPKGIPRVKPASQVLHVRSLLTDEISKGTRYQGVELTIRERSLANDLLDWFLSRSKIPFEKRNIEWNAPRSHPKQRDDDDRRTESEPDEQHDHPGAAAEARDEG